MTTNVMQLDRPRDDCRATPSAAGFRPWFRADWRGVVFVHYAIDPAVLQPHVPYELDLFEGRAWVSLVAFTQSGMRPAIGGAVGATVMKPVATHAFLNLRTYVSVEGHRAILFLAEWIPNRLAMLVGPRLYGLPFRMGRLAYGERRRDVTAEGAALRLTATADGPECEAARGSVDEFLLERYTAYTCRDGRGRAFHIAHEPWIWRRAAVAVEDDRLIRQAAPWFSEARPVCAHVSDGAFDVGIGGPARAATAYDAPPLPAGRWDTWGPLVILPLGALLAGDWLPAWAFMWVLALGIFFGCKWATWRQAKAEARRAGWARSLGYLLAWPGMDARAFLAERPLMKTGATPALVRAVTGAGLLWVGARHAPDQLLGGWVGMVGLILVLHFGLFDLLAAAWQRLGVRAEPIMRSPIKARSLTEFWGGRWNAAFHELARTWVFTPLLRRVGVGGAALAAFLVSGWVHDAVISLPAGAGFGWPTIYFLAQFAGIRVERSRWGRRHLRGVAGRVFTVAVTVLPAPLLFHSAFVVKVIVPFMRVVGAY